MAPSRSPLRIVLDALWHHNGDRDADPEAQQAWPKLTDRESAYARDFAIAVQTNRQQGWQPDYGGPSTARPQLLPDIPSLRRLCQSLATLDAILSPEWEFRLYSFDCAWDAGEMCGSMRNGCGDDLFIHFSKAGALIKGFAHEYSTSPWSALAHSYNDQQPGLWPGMIDNIPDCFSQVLTEPAFNWEATTFCIWRTATDAQWNVGNLDLPEYDTWEPAEQPMQIGAIADADGSSYLLEIFDGKPETYRAFAQSYFSAAGTIPLAVIEDIYQHRPLDQNMFQKLNPKVDVDEILVEIQEEIGYPQPN